MNRYTLFILVHVEDFRQRDGYRRIIRIYFHDIRHIIPPFLHNRIGSHILRGLFSSCFLTGEKNICIFIPIDRIIIYSTIGQHFFSSGQMAACLFSYSFSNPGFKNILKASRFIRFLLSIKMLYDTEPQYPLLKSDEDYHPYRHH